MSPLNPLSVSPCLALRLQLLGDAVGPNAGALRDLLRAARRLVRGHRAGAAPHRVRRLADAGLSEYEGGLSFVHVIF